MLINIDPILSPELLHALRSMGHGDKLVLADANFPSASLATPRSQQPDPAAAPAIGPPEGPDPYAAMTLASRGCETGCARLSSTTPRTAPDSYTRRAVAALPERTPELRPRRPRADQ